MTDPRPDDLARRVDLPHYPIDDTPQASIAILFIAMGLGVVLLALAAIGAWTVWGWVR